MKVNSSMMTVCADDNIFMLVYILTFPKIRARLLPSPELQFGRNSTVDSRSTEQGQWNLQGKTFVKTSTLKSFGCLIFAPANKCPIETAKKYMRSLMAAYTGHGGIVENNNPLINYATPPSIGKSIQEFWRAVGNQVKMRPQILFFIVPFKQAMPYNEIKQFCETELGCVSQCEYLFIRITWKKITNTSVLGALLQHVFTCKPQYLSNVCMKLNAKVGGATCYLTPSNNRLHNRGFNMMIGADVSHAAPGVQKPSFASMVGSTDCKYFVFLSR